MSVFSTRGKPRKSVIPQPPKPPSGPKRTKQTNKQVKAIKRQMMVAEAVHMRLAGNQYKDIALAQGCSTTEVAARVKEGLLQTAATLEQDATQLRTLEIERIESMWRAVFPSAIQGDL